MSIKKNTTYHRNYKFHYIYKITCLCGNLKGYYYIGKHSTTKEDAELDGYYGGGVIIRKYYEKYPPVLGKTIKKEILEYNPTIIENSIRETEIIGDLWKTDPMCLNRKKGGEGGNGHANKGKVHSPEQNEAQSRFWREYYKTHRGPNVGNGDCVECFDDNGEFVGRFESRTLAGKVFGQSYINWGLRNESHKEAGFRWRHADSMFSPITESIGKYVKPKKVMPDYAIEKMKESKKGLRLYSTRVEIIATDENGVETEYNGIVDAAEKLHPENIKSAQKNIQAACKGARKKAYGRTWRFKDGEVGEWNKKVVQYDLNWNEINRFNSISEAAEVVGVRAQNISRCCGNPNLTCGGYKWKRAV